MLTDRDDTNGAIAVLEQALEGGAGWDARGELAERLAAQGRMTEAVAMLRPAVDAGDVWNVHRLAEIYVAMGDPPSAIAVLQRSVDQGDPLDEAHLVPLMAEHLGIAALGELARSGNQSAAKALVDALVEASDVPGLRALAGQRERPVGQEYAALDSAPLRAGRRLADLLVEQGDHDGAVEVLRSAIADGDAWALSRLVARLTVAKDLAGLRELAHGGCSDAARQLAQLLSKHHDGLEEMTALAGKPVTDSRHVRRQLVRMLVEQGDTDRLRQLADAGDPQAAAQLAQILAQNDDVAELSRRADLGDHAAAGRLAEVLARHDDIPELRREVLRGSQHAKLVLLAHLEEHDQAAAEQVRRFGLAADGTVQR